jgi:hypothetical protein
MCFDFLLNVESGLATEASDEAPVLSARFQVVIATPSVYTVAGGVSGCYSR